MATTYDEEWEEYNPNSGLTLMDHMLAGSCAGVMEHIAMFPFDTLKTHLQAKSSINATTRSMYSRLTHKQGFVRLWRGVHSLAIGCVPAHAAYFSIYELAKEKFGANRPGHHPLAAAAAGGLAVCVHDAVMTPVDVVKQRLQLGFYRGMIDCIRIVSKTEGIRAFFVSYPTTLAMNIPHHAVMVAANESFKVFLTPLGQDIANQSFLVFAVSGAAAGALAAIITNPLDVIKTRLQTQGIEFPHDHMHSTSPSSAPSSVRHMHNSINPPGHTRGVATRLMPSSAFAPISTRGRGSRRAAAQNGFISVARQIFLQEGWIGFSRGLVPRLLLTAPSSAISWTTYEVLKQMLLKIHSSKD